MKIELHIVDVNQNSTTGHIEMNAYIVETLDDGTEIKGPVETHGIDPLALETRYGPDQNNVTLWLAEVKKVMASRHDVRKNTRSDIHALAGKRI